MGRVIKNIARLEPVTLLLGTALLAGILLRALGVDFCLPMVHCHPDEHFLVKPAMKMLRTGDFNPHYFVYPTLFMYILVAVYAVTYLAGVSGGLWKNIQGITPAPFHLAGRITTACLGSATLGGVYVAGKRILDPLSGAVAALALAVMPLHVSASHFVTTDVPAGFFCALALCAAASVATGGGRKAYILAGLFVGFAAAAKYNAMMVAVNIPLAHWINSKRERFWSPDLLRGLSWIVIGFLIACPYALFDLPRFLDGVAHEIAHYKRAHVGHEGDFNRLFFFVFLASRGFGPVLTALGIYGLVRMIKNFERRYLLLLVFPALYLLFVGSYRVRFVRNLMPVLPYFALWIGYGAVQLLARLRATWPRLGQIRPWKVALPGLAVALVIPLSISSFETLGWATDDTRLQAKQWIEKNLSPGTSIYLQAWSVDSLPHGRYRISRNRFSWDFYVATDRLSRKYFDMKTIVPVKHREVQEAFQHRPVAVFEGRNENPFYCSSHPTVLIFARDASRRAIAPPPPPPRRR